MAFAIGLVRYLIRNGVSYQVVAHRPTVSSAAAAHMVGVSAAWLAKSVVLKDDEGARGDAGRFAPPSRSSAPAIAAQLDFATEEELRALSRIASVGAVPPFGSVYGLEVNGG